MDRNDRLKDRLKVKKKRLLDKLIYKLDILKDKRLIKAFIDVPLEHFIPKKFMNVVKLYEDVPNLFYYDESNPRSYRTISAPHMITIMLQGLNLEESDDLLILGAKSGYIAALAQKLAPKGEIIILEANSDIAKLTTENLKKLKLDDNVTIIVKNPLKGAPDLCPWHKILVTGAIEQSKIYPLLNQLDKDGGVLFAPIGSEMVQNYTQILRQGEAFFGKKQLQVKFSPLITQLELDDLELITDFEEFGITDSPDSATDYEKSLWDKKVAIKYTSDILDNITPEEIKTKFINRNELDLVVSYFESVAEIVKSLKLEEDINKFFTKIDAIDNTFEKLRKYKRNFELKIKKIQNRLNQIRSYSIVRKELENKDLSDPAILEQKISVINQQLLEINHLIELIKEEIKRIKYIY
ncbi:MAG: hypothetical protein KAX18_06310 [Candidatus Lokiarchaeota archaeon]|nr:hypothetical protein [Candidatus Lokiarchaeota archaeon]